MGAPKRCPGKEKIDAGLSKGARRNLECVECLCCSVAWCPPPNRLKPGHRTREARRETGEGSKQETVLPNGQRTTDKNQTNSNQFKPKFLENKVRREEKTSQIEQIRANTRQTSPKISNFAQLKINI